MLKIVLTGGPSSGKTTVLNKIQEEYKELGYYVIVVPETATELINSGIRPFGDNAISLVEFQKCVLETQLRKESVAEYAAKMINEEKTIIVFDRGTVDGYGYVNEYEWKGVLINSNVNHSELLNNYDAIIYLESNEAYFTKENNTARYESDAKEALLKAKRTLKGYMEHDNLTIIKSRDKMEEKINEVISCINSFISYPKIHKFQKKFLVGNVDIQGLNRVEGKVLIEQFYIRYNNDYENEYRVRKTINEGSEINTFNIIKKFENGEREVSKTAVITDEEYEMLMNNLRISDIIRKTRYSILDDNLIYKLDIFDDGLMLLECNVKNIEDEVNIPSFMEIIEEVTLRDEYQNINIIKENNYGKRTLNRN